MFSASLNVLLISRTESKLKAAAAEITTAYGVEVRSPLPAVKCHDVVLLLLHIYIQAYATILLIAVLLGRYVAHVEHPLVLYRAHFPGLYMLWVGKQSAGVRLQCKVLAMDLVAAGNAPYEGPEWDALKAMLSSLDIGAHLLLFIITFIIAAASGWSCQVKIPPYLNGVVQGFSSTTRARPHPQRSCMSSPQPRWTASWRSTVRQW